MPAPQPDLLDFTDYDSIRSRIFDTVPAALSSKPAIENSRFRLELSDLKYTGKPFTLDDQRKAILGNKDLTWQLKGTWTLKDLATGNPVDSVSSVVAHVPYLTPRGTFIRRGTEYTVAKQSRLKPGIYARRKESGELEAHVNVESGSGRAFRVMLEPDTGKFKMLIGQASLPLASVLRSLGTTRGEMEAAWGKDLTDQNSKDDPKVLSKLMYHFGPKRGDIPKDEVSYLRGAFEKMRMDPSVNENTMKMPGIDRISPSTLLSIAQRLVKIQKGEDDVDDRDSLSFQTLHSVDDFLAEHVKKDAGGVMRRMLWEATNRGGSLKGLRGSDLDPYVDQLFLSSFASPLEETNPLEILDQQQRVTRLGPGGIPSSDAIPEESRNVGPSQFLFVDPIKAPESTKAGVDMRLSYKTYRSGNQIKAEFKGTDGKKYYLSPEEASKKVVAFPDDYEGTNKYVRAMAQGRVTYVPRSKVELLAPDPESMYSIASNLVPMTSSVKGHRLLMGGKMLTQAMALREGEAPLVQSATPEDSSLSFEQLAGKHAGAIYAPAAGVVVKSTPTEVVVKDSEGKLHSQELYQNFPYNRRSFIHNTSLVKVGDVVKPGQLLANSNYTDKTGALSLGKNLRTAYAFYEGKNYEDAVVISESAAKKLASEHMYQQQLDRDNEVQLGDKKAFVSLYPGTYTKDQLSLLDDKGVVRPGAVVRPGDPLILALGKSKPSGASAIYRPHKLTPTDRTLTWEHNDVGLVTDVTPTKGGWNVIVKAYSPAIVGDKLTQRYGGKGVIAEIVPDDQMLKDESGQPVDIVMNPAGLITRVNPAQIAETLLGKVAEKTGKPYKIRGFQPNHLQYAYDEAKAHGVKDTENLVDPKRGIKIKNVLVGRTFFTKLHHMAEHKEHGRAVSGEEDVVYTSDQLPAKGGPTGAKRFSLQDINALMAAGASEVVRDAHLIKGQRNDAYWKMLRLGHSPPTPRGGFIHDKLLEMLRGSGVNVRKQGNKLHVMALTNADIEKLSRGEITNDQTVDRNTLDPIPGGLFDLKVTGGHDGRQWSHIPLDEPMPNPVMEDPLRTLLGLTRAEFESVIAGKHQLATGTGPKGLKAALERINVDKEIEHANADIRSGKVTRRDKAIKRLGYLTTMKERQISPVDLMWDKMPVIPPAFRAAARLSGEKIILADANGLYRDVFQANQALKKLKPQLGDEGTGDERVALYRAIKAATGLGDPVGRKSSEQKLRGLLSHVFGSSPKWGIVQRALISKPQDAVGRAVISPDPSLDLDQVGLPTDMAWSIYSPFIMRRLIRAGTDAQDASIYVSKRHPLAQKALLDEMEHRPVIVNRAPTLHRFSVQAFWPVLTKGSTIRVTPLVTPGFNADFDGDTQSAYVPVSEEARKEAIEKLLPSRNLLDSTRFEVHLMPRQEYLYGLSAATGGVGRASAEKPRIFRSAAEVLLAYKRGEIGARDPVRIQEM